MSVTTSQAVTLLENVLFESATLAAANAPGWVTLSVVNSAYSTVAGLAAAMSGTAEASIAAQVVRYYEGALGRAPAGSEIAYYVDQVETGLATGTALTASQIAQGATAVPQASWNLIASEFSNSPEFAFASASASSVVTLLYLNILGRSPTATEVGYYNGQLSAGLGNSTLVQEFVNSPEYQAKVSSGIANSLSGYGAGIVGGAAPGTIPTITTTPIVTNFTLTAGVDPLTGGTAGNNVFTATDDANGNQTWSALDSITGSGANNTFNFSSSTALGGTPLNATVTGVQTANFVDTAGITVDTTGFTGLATETTAVGAAATVDTLATTTSLTATGGGDITVTGGNNVTVVGSAGKAVISGEVGVVTLTETQSTGVVTIDDGTNVTATLTAKDAGAAVVYGAVTVGSTTAPSGNVSVTDTVTLTAASTSPNITVSAGGTATINYTLNAGAAVGASQGTNATTYATPTAGDAGSLGVAAATGAVSITQTDNLTAKATVAVHADDIIVTGGSTVTINQTLGTVNQAATSVSTLAEGNVFVTGGAATTTVTVNQAALHTGAIAVKAVTAVAAVSGTTALAASPGQDAIAAVAGIVAVPGVTAKAGTGTVASDGNVSIADANAASGTTANTITAISLSNAGAVTIADNALTSYTLAGKIGTTSLTNAATIPTNTALTLNLNAATAGVITDVNHEVTTLNVVTGGTKASTLAGFTDSGLTTLNVSGTQTLKLTTVTTGVDAALTKIAVSGAAGFSGDVSGFGAALALSTTSSGTITATLDDTTQTFTGSTGTDVITIAGDATKAITGGSATNNEIILSGTAATYTAKNFGAHVTGFTTLGVSDGTATADSYDMHGLFTGYNAIDVVTASATSNTFTGVATGTTLQIENTAASISYVLFNASSTASAAVTLGTAASTAGITVTTLSLNDSNGDGVATLNLTAAATTTGLSNTITTLTDNALSTLNVSGSGNLTIGTLVLGVPGSTPANGVASLTLNDNLTGTSGLTITTLTDDTLGTLNVTGSNVSTITTLNVNKSTNLTISNTSAGTFTIGDLATTGPLANLIFTGSAKTVIHDLSGVTAATVTITNSGTGAVVLDDTTDFADATLTSLTLSGNIALNADSLVVAGTGTAATGAAATGATTGVTVAAGTDNAHINLNLTGALGGAAVVDTVTLGNGNNWFVDGSTDSTVKVTVGTGSNLIDIHSAAAGNKTYSATVTLGAHTGVDQINVSAIGTNTTVNTVITGATTNDLIKITDGVAGTNVVTLTSSQSSALTADSSLAQAITDAHGLTTAHGAVVFTYGTNTYVVEDVAAATGAATSTVIELVGIHTVGVSATGVFKILS